MKYSGAGLSALLVFLAFQCGMCTLGDLSQATVMVTGAAGFIGSHLVMNLVKKGCRSVVAVDNFGAYYSVYLKRLRADLVTNTTKIKITEGDVCDINFMKSMFLAQSFTHVVHLAAQPGVRYSFVKPLSYIRNNIECFTVLMEQIRLSHETPRRAMPRVLYASSSSVYGLNEKIPFSEEDPVLHPSNLYGATKRADELLAHSYHHLYGITTVGFRFFTVYGPRGRPDMAAALFTEGIMSGKTLTLYNKGELLRDYTFVDDIVDGLTAAVARVENDKFMVYNLGNKKPVTTNTFLSLLEGYLGKKANVRYEDSKADMAITFANTSLAAANLEFEAKTSIEEGLRRYTDWFKAHETSLMPCVAECSHSNMCFKSGWDEAAAESRQLTEQCKTVLYTVVTSTRPSELPAVPEGGVGCSFAFVNENSALLKQIGGGNAKRGKYENWVVIPVGDVFGDSKYPTKVPKMNPGKFFADNVQYAVYVDPFVALKVPLQQVVGKMVSKDSGEKAAFAAVEQPSPRVRSVYDEFDTVYKLSKTRPSAYSRKVEEHKLSCKSNQEKYTGLQFANVLDGSLLVHDLKSAVGKQFRCRWFREHQEWADRDHLSLAITVGMMNYEFSVDEGGARGEWLGIGKEGGNPVYLHMLPRDYNPLYAPKSNSGAFFYDRKHIGARA